MGKRRFLSKHRIKRSVIKEDLLCFGLPGILVYVAGLAISAKDGWVELPPTIWNFFKYPRELALLSVPNILGIILFVFGFAILITAQITLGRYYSSGLVIREDHRLIKHGIYHLTRHPIYLRVLMVCIGLPVFASSLVGLLTMSILILVFLIRIRIEERMLIEEFGDVYQRYREETSKLIPFIY